MLLSWQELKVPQAYTISQQIMSHGKVIKNRSLGQAHSLKEYMIFLFLSLSLLSSLYFVFMLFFSVIVFLLFAFSAFLSESIIPPKTQSSHLVFHNRDPPHWRLNLHCISQSGAHAVVMHFISGVDLSFEESQEVWLFLMNTGVMVILPLKRCSMRA